VIVVLDTNILISAALRSGFPERALLHCAQTESLSWYISLEILGEYHEVLHRPKFSFPAPKLAYWRNLIARSTILMEDIPPLDFPRDRKDAKFLALARATSADYLITGDTDVTDVPPDLLPHTRILSASQFCAKMHL
jgi:putative PIN family toxin of toxin-antitoxin system